MLNSREDAGGKRLLREKTSNKQERCEEIGGILDQNDPNAWA